MENFNINSKNYNKLNLGCGEKILDGFINVDFYQKDKRILKIDLNKLPLPFNSNTFDLIYIHHTLEHVLYPYELIMDCNRILKDGGILNITVPSFGNSLTHQRWYHTLTYFHVLYNEDKKRDYQINNFKLISLKTNNFVFHETKKIKKLIMRFYSWVISILYGEIDITLKKCKNDK